MNSRIHSKTCPLNGLHYELCIMHYELCIMHYELCIMHYELYRFPPHLKMDKKGHENMMMKLRKIPTFAFTTSNSQQAVFETLLLHDCKK